MGRHDAAHRVQPARGGAVRRQDRERAARPSTRAAERRRAEVHGHVREEGHVQGALRRPPEHEGHGPGGSTKPGDTAEKRKARAAKERAAQTATVTALVKKANKATGNVVSIAPAPRRPRSRLPPGQPQGRVGSTVTFKMDGWNEVHTVTFGPKAFVEGVAKKAFEGQPRHRRRGHLPQRPAHGGRAVAHAHVHGNGYLNSGELSDPGTGIPGRRRSRSPSRWRERSVHLPRPPRDARQDHCRLAHPRRRDGRPSGRPSCVPRVLRCTT